MSSSRTPHEQTDVSKLRVGELFRMLFQGVTVALLVAQLLLPADGTTATDGASLPLVMLWLLLFAFWLVGGVWRFQTGIRIGVVDLALLLLILWHTLSGLWALGLTTRESVNMTWQWIAAGCCFFSHPSVVHQSPRVPHPLGDFGRSGRRSRGLQLLPVDG